MIAELAQTWPGKSYPSEHPALWHILDVGAVARHLLALRSVGEPAVNSAIACLVSLHDLGKISWSFRAMLQHGHRQKWRHWEHTGALLACHDQVLAKCLGGTDEVRRILAEAIAGHHGGPRELRDASYRSQQLDEIGQDALRDAKTAIRAVAGLFPDASLDGVSEHQAQAMSWQVNGLTVQADWIGSNTDWFGPIDPSVPLSDYWIHAQRQAAIAVTAAGVRPASPCRTGASRILPDDLVPHPMQSAALTAELADGPILSVIEDATGAGKTEAALILASRMMAADKGAGIFFALPTMATANAMLPRLDSAAPDLFETSASLALSHGRAHLSRAFRDIRGRDGSNPEDGPHCGRWLADDRRRVLLADIGVGTIDQALFSVLPTRFNGLRLRALSQKILIVDEAHSYDPYMQAQLERLLTFQARLGGSAIVMTATLPQQMKQAFVTAFQSGLDPARPATGSRRKRPHTDPDPDAPYPALSMVGRQTRLTAVNPAPSTVRRVAVRHLSDPEQAVELIRNYAAQGAACIWIRNAVDDAVAGVDQLRAVGISANLLHARFALCDRLRHETALQARFGKSGRGRAGRVLVATQVAEQSLDLDFDVMVSDLAPIGALIQRAGRLWRHMGLRPVETRPTSGPVLHILSPDPDRVDTARWVHQTLDRGAFVYPQPVLWRSARALFDAAEIQAPDGLRPLIEAVEGAGVDRLSVPAVLESAVFEYEGQQIVERQLAHNCLVSAHDAFDQPAMARVWDDEQFPTRLGVPQVTLALARRKSGQLEPLAPEGPDRWALSEVQVSAARFDPVPVLDQTLPEIIEIKKTWSESRARHTWIAVLEEDGRISDTMSYNSRSGVIWTADSE